MAPTDRFVCRFVAEPPQELLPYGRWAITLREHFRAACERLDGEGEDLGQPEAVVFYPDRTWAGRTYVPATARTTTGFELFGAVSFTPAPEGGQPSGFDATADFTGETAEANPEWRLDLCDEVVGRWRGDHGRTAQMTLVWGVPMVAGGAIVTADLADLTVDQCELVEDRFTLLAPDDYRGDTLEVHLWNSRGDELARESLYD